MDAQYMALIEELERQVAQLERELADCRARVADGDRRSRRDIGKVPVAPPTNVTADGTRGMTRGVSGPARPTRGTGSKG
jgi:hypothetical protein